MRLILALSVALACYGAGPTISGFTLSAVSSSELLAVWTTDVTADSTVSCGTSSGVYTLSSGTVNPLTRGYSVTDHSVTIPGLSPTTLYLCVVTSASAGGSTTSSEHFATTRVALSRRVMRLTTIGPLVRYNDQYPGNGRHLYGDSHYCAWSGDGNTRCSVQDGYLPNTTTTFDTDIVLWPTASDKTYTNATLVNAMTAAGTTQNGINVGGWSDGQGFRTMGAFSIWDRASQTSILYDSIFRSDANGTVFSNVDIVKSPDYGVHWISPQNNTGPGVVGATAGDFPTPGHSMWASVGVTGRLVPIQQCQDHRDCPNSEGNARTYQYFFDNNYILGASRMRVEDVTLQDATKMEYYHGANSGTDGTFAAAWTSSATSQTRIPLAQTGMWPVAVWIPDFNRYLWTSWDVVNSTPGSEDLTPTGLLFLTSDYIWSVPTQLARLANTGVPSGYKPAFPNVQLATYTKTSESPLKATIKLLVSGFFTGANPTDPTLNQYSVFLYDLVLTEPVPSTMASGVTISGGVGIR